MEEAWYSWNWKLGDPPSGRTIYQYDDLGHLLSIQYLAPNPAMSWETRNKLDAEGRIAETETFYAGQPTMRQTWEYDEQGRKISETTVFFKEEFISFHDPKPGRVTWKYDDAAGVVEQTHYDTLGNPVTVIRTASDEQGNRTAADEYQLNNSLATIGNIELNGLKAKVTWSAGSPAVIYEYDEQGNWIRAIHTRKSQFNLDSPRTTDFIEERAIEYYSPRPL